MPFLHNPFTATVWYAEILAMTEQLLSAEDLAELKRFPALWRDYQEALVEGERQRADRYPGGVGGPLRSAHIGVSQSRTGPRQDR